MTRRSTFVRTGRLLAMLPAALMLTAAPRGESPGMSLALRPMTSVSAPAARNDELEAELERIRRVTRRFHDIAAAYAAGYPTEVPQCVESPAGGMGHHYIRRDLLDDSLDVEKPEILVYAPTRDGRLKFAGVEYVGPYAAWSEDTAPRILGQALKRSDELQIWYLHVWVWEENPKGMFADWNPAVKCAP